VLWSDANAAEPAAQRTSATATGQLPARAKPTTDRLISTEPTQNRRPDLGTWPVEAMAMAPAKEPMPAAAPSSTQTDRVHVQHVAGEDGQQLLIREHQDVHQCADQQHADDRSTRAGKPGRRAGNAGTGRYSPGGRRRQGHDFEQQDFATYSRT